MSSPSSALNTLLTPLLERSTPFAPSFFDKLPASDVLEEIANQRVLIVGVGALGCETLKNMVLSGYRDITLVDMDTIDVSNLNRQFMFSPQDVGLYKATVAERFIRDRRPHVNITSKTTSIQSFPKTWLSSFHLVILCLDNMETRLWVNEAILDIIQYKPTRYTFHELRTLCRQHLLSTLTCEEGATSCNPPGEKRDQLDLEPLEHTTIPLVATPPVKIKGLKDPRIIVIPPNHTEGDAVGQLGDATVIGGDADTDLNSQMTILQQIKELGDGRVIIITTPTIRDVESMIPFVESGTEGWKGHAQFIMPTETHCLACAQPPDAGMQRNPNDDLHTHICTLAAIPRRPEHCIMYAQLVEWPRLISFTSRLEYVQSGSNHTSAHSGDQKSQQDAAHSPFGPELDPENHEHILWILDRAIEHANKHGMSPIPTLPQTLHVIKHIIPAISSTNALTASIGTLEALKYTTQMASIGNGMVMYSSDNYTTGIGLSTVDIHRSPTCRVCQPISRVIISRQTMITFGQFVVWVVQQSFGFHRGFVLEDILCNNPDDSMIYMSQGQQLSSSPHGHEDVRNRPLQSVLKPFHRYLLSGKSKPSIKFELEFL